MGAVSINGIGPYVHKDRKAVAADVAAGVDDKKYTTPYAIKPDQVRQDVEVLKNRAEIENLKDLVTNNVTTNQWTEDFSDISHVEVIRGNYNSLYQRLDCSKVEEVV